MTFPAGTDISEINIMDRTRSGHFTRVYQRYNTNLIWRNLCTFSESRASDLHPTEIVHMINRIIFSTFFHNRAVCRRSYADSTGGTTNYCVGTRYEMIKWEGLQVFFRWDNSNKMQLYDLNVREIVPP